jgi:hypothetical protein
VAALVEHALCTLDTSLKTLLKIFVLLALSDVRAEQRRG